MACDTSDQTEGKNWGYYSLKDGNCRICKKHCLIDDSCEAIECGTSYCRWWKNNKCNRVSDLFHSNVGYLQTCVKHVIGICKDKNIHWTWIKL